MNDMARETIIDYYRNPRNKGHLEHPTVSHEEKNATCGDVIHLDLLIEDDIVKNIRYDGQGCSISQASASMLTEMVMGKHIDEVKAITKDDIMDALGVETLGPSRIKCALLSLKVLKAGVYGVNSWGDE